MMRVLPPPPCPIAAGGTAEAAASSITRSTDRLMWSTLPAWGARPYPGPDGGVHAGLPGGPLVPEGPRAPRGRRGAPDGAGGRPAVPPHAGHELPGGGRRRRPPLLGPDGRPSLHRRLRDCERM